MRRLSVPALPSLLDRGAIRHVAEQEPDVVQGRLVQRRGVRGYAIAGQDGVEPATYRISQAALDADVGLHPGEDQGPDTAPAQLILEIGPDKGAVATLLDDSFALRGRHAVELVPPASGAATDLPALLALLDQHALRQAIRIVVRLDPENRNAMAARRRDQIHDRRDHRAAGGNVLADDAFDITPLGAEIILHIDHQNRHMRRIEPFVHRVEQLPCHFHLYL